MRCSMKIALCVLSVLITVSYISSYNTCWAIHDDDSISKVVAWDSNIGIEKRDSLNPDKDSDGTLIDIFPFFNDGNKDEEPESKDDDKGAPEYTDPDNNDGIKK